MMERGNRGVAAICFSYRALQSPMNGGIVVPGAFDTREKEFYNS